MDNELIKEVSKSIRGLYELTTRVDERLKAIEEKQEKLDERISGELHSIENEVKNINKEINALDKRIIIVESLTENQESKWKTVIGYVMYGVFILIICYLLYLLKINPPPIP